MKTTAKVWQVEPNDWGVREGWYAEVYPKGWISATECPCRRYDTKEKAMAFARKLGAEIEEL